MRRGSHPLCGSTVGGPGALWGWVRSQQSSWGRIKEQNITGDIVGCLCYRPAGQEEQADEVPVFAAPGSHREFQPPQHCWKDSIAGHRQSRTFQDTNFLTQVTEMPGGLWAGRANSEVDWEPAECLGRDGAGQ